MKKAYRPTEEDQRLVLEAACDLASTIHRFIHERPKIHKFGMTVVGHAIEMILSQADGNWDEVSNTFRDFLGDCHNDLKKISREGEMPS